MYKKKAFEENHTVIHNNAILRKNIVHKEIQSTFFARVY